TQMFVHLVWNPYIGLVFLVTAAATSWVVAAGRFGWWPVAVLSASVSAQGHLVYAVAAVALVAVGPLVALANGHRPTRWRWLVMGVAVGVVCWTPPLVQQVFGSPGNLTLLLHADAARSPVGPGFGLHALSTAAAPYPIWLTKFPVLTALPDQMPHYLDGHGVGWGVVVLCLLGAVAVTARWARHRDLSALAVIVLVLSFGTIVSFGAVPKDQLGPVGYLADVLWVVGALVWLVLAWATAALGAALLGRWRGCQAGDGMRLLFNGGLAMAGFVLLVLLGVAGVRALEAGAPASVAVQRVDAALDGSIARSVQKKVPSGPVVVVVRPSAFTLTGPVTGGTLGYYVVDYWGTAMVLMERGSQPGLRYTFYGQATHLTVPNGARWPEVVVSLDRSNLRVTSAELVTPTRPGR
ncbi:MAG: hypothetical protein ACRDYE_07930, partial [Acidimicrobiales bacterium]